MACNISIFFSSKQYILFRSSRIRRGSLSAQQLYLRTEDIQCPAYPRHSTFKPTFGHTFRSKTLVMSRAGESPAAPSSPARSPALSRGEREDGGRGGLIPLPVPGAENAGRGEGHARIGSLPGNTLPSAVAERVLSEPNRVHTITEGVDGLALADDRAPDGVASISITFSPSTRQSTSLPTPKSGDRHVSFVPSSPPSTSSAIAIPSAARREAGVAPLVSPVSSARSVPLGSATEEGFASTGRRPRSLVSDSESHSPGSSFTRLGFGRPRRYSAAESLGEESEQEAEDDDDYSDFLATLQDDRDRRPTLPLTPFSDQVGGHTPFLRFSDKAVCKPLDEVERDFYENADPELTEFMAGYLGVVDVTYGVSEVPGRLARQDWWERTPVVVLDPTTSVLDEEDDPEHAAKSRSAPSPHYNAALRKQIFREALSPRSLRARFAQLKSTMGQLRPNTKLRTGRRHHTDGEEEEIGKPHTKGYSSLRYSPRRSSAVDRVLHSPNSAKSGVSDELVELEAENGEFSAPFQTLDIPDSPIRANPNGFPSQLHSPEINPIFQMSDDESEDRRKSGTSASRTPPPNLSPRANLSLPASTQSTFNPWSLQMLEKLNSKMSETKTQQFLLLEDLTGGMKHPCILDLKMGTRQHGIFASREKKESQERKCERTTSKQLGVRICGMQVFKVDTETYYYTDKYYGRRVQVADFRESLLSFLDNGTHLLLGYIPMILEKLKRLHSVVERLGSYRFYASSLLILYDADWFSPESTGAAIGTALRRSPEAGDSDPIEGSDSETDASLASEDGWESDLEEDAEEELPRRRPASAKRREEARRIEDKEILVKMIDFSHSLRNRHLLISAEAPGEDDSVIDPATGTRVNGVRCNYPPTTRGPDNGYLRGLDNLIGALQDLLSSYKVNRHISWEEARRMGGLRPSTLSSAESGVRFDD